MKTLLFTVALVLSPLALRAEPTPILPAPVVKTEAVSAVPAVSDTTKYAELVNGDVKVGDVVANGAEVYQAIQEYRAAKAEGRQGLLALVMVALAAVFKLLLSLVKIVLAKDFWKSPKGKLALRVSCVFLGLGVMVAAKIGMGMGWGDSVLLAVSGPGALAVHELTDLLMGAKGVADAGPAKV